MALTDNLVSFWELEEASGTRSDSHGTNHLTDNNTVTQNTGKVGNCAEFSTATQEYLSIADNASVSIGAGISVTWVAWIYMAAGPSGILGKWSGTQPEYTLFYNGTTFQFSVKNTTNTAQTDCLSTFSPISSGTWYFIVAQYDGSALKLSINDITPDTVSYSGGINDSNGTFMVGSWYDNTTTWNGRLDQVGFWKRALDTTEISYLYNSGAGRSYADIAGAGGPPALIGVAVNATAGEAQRPGLPEEPRLYYDTTYVAPTPATTFTPADATAFQAALNSAVAGDEIRLTAGASYTGNFNFPVKSGSSYIHIRSSAALTTEGVRITTAQAAAFPKIVTNNAGAAIQIAAGAFYYRIINCEITSGSTPVNGYAVGMGTGDELSAADFPHHIIVDRCYIHGHASAGGRRGVMFAGSYQAVIDSYISDYKEVGSDTQAVAGWTGYGPYKVVNNYLEGAGENLIFGGSGTGVTNLTPADIEIRGNHCFKPLSWKLGHPSYAGTHWSVKNSFELKHCARVLVEDNTIENCWADSQNGFCVLFTVRNQGGGNPWSVIKDITFRNNTILNSDNGINMLGIDTESVVPSQRSRRLLISDNLMKNIGGSWHGDGQLFMVLDNYEDITIDHNTVLHDTAVPTGGCIIIADYAPTQRFTFKNNITQQNVSGIFGTGYGPGNSSIDYYFPGSTITKNVMQGTDNTAYYPAGNYFPATLAAIGFENLAGGDYRLDPTSPYHNAATDGTDIGAILGPAAPAFKAAWAASCNQMIV